MEILGKVHLMFEQSGVFKNEFKKLGYDAEDYDIQNNFSETDNVVDLFDEIEKKCKPNTPDYAELMKEIQTGNAGAVGEMPCKSTNE